jgi:phospholipid transport system substrate-binding protein
MNIKSIFAKVLGVSTFIGILLSSSVSFAGEATDFIEVKQDKLFDLIKNFDSKSKINAALDELIDFDFIVKDALGDEWDNLNPTQKSEFSRLFKELFRKSYENNLKKTLRYHNEYVGEESVNGATYVKMRITESSKDSSEPIDVEFKVVKTENGLKVRDVVTEDESVVKSYRSQFLRVIRKDGIQVLLRKMKNRLKNSSMVFL